MIEGIAAGFCTFGGFVAIVFLLVAWDAHRERKRREQLLDELRRRHRA